MTKTVALGIEYCGTHFHGWQKQSGKIRTVQAVLERALSKVADESIQTTCAGRTDTGVHGLAQVVHFQTEANRKNDAWLLGANSFLPPDVRVLWAESVANDFNARFSATARQYQYIILNTAFHSALLHQQVTWERKPLDANLMHQGAQYLLGENDYSSFRASECQSHSPNRNIEFISAERKNDFVIINIKANAFLHHMVRNIVGVLLEVGQRKKPVEWVQSVLQAKSRTAASRTAAANGLYLVDVNYPLHLLTQHHARYPNFS